MRFKTASTFDYVLGSPPKPQAETNDGAGGGGTGQEVRSLTEEAGRLFAARELKNMGFSVETMPFENPGFDLRAKRNDEELRVEVKSHTGRASVVDVTQRQYREYLDQQGFRWELWNVEHLAEMDVGSVVITRYTGIPDDALDVRTYRVDLKKCQVPQIQPITP
jgi:hypothetical protein